MSSKAEQIAQMVDMLPDNEKSLAFEIVKRMVLAWDSDFTKLTNAERESMEFGDRQIMQGETVSHDAINWN